MTICVKSSNLSTPRRKTRGPGSDCGCRAALCRNTGDRFVYGAGPMGARPEPCFRSSYLSGTKSGFGAGHEARGDALVVGHVVLEVVVVAAQVERGKIPVRVGPVAQGAYGGG